MWEIGLRWRLHGYTCLQLLARAFSVKLLITSYIDKYRQLISHPYLVDGETHNSQFRCSWIMFIYAECRYKCKENRVPDNKYFERNALNLCQSCLMLWISGLP